MRFVELQRLKHNPKWVLSQSHHIHLPKGANFKVKCKQSERWITLNPLGYEIITNFLNPSIKLPTKQTLNENLKRWGLKAKIDCEGLCIKSFRKTWESWLITIYKENVYHIFLSQGHDELTALKHYLNLPFAQQDKHQMLKYCGGIEW